MKLPLFVSALPSASLVSPSVLIGRGLWRLRSNHTSSLIELRSKCDTLNLPVSDGMEIPVESSTITLVATMKIVGKESSLTLFLERVT